MKPFNLQYWKRLIAKEWLPALISLLLAVVLWYNVGGEQTVDTSVMIPVEVINLPRQLVISNQFKKEIEVTVNGPRTLILEMENQQISRQIDLSQATPGTTVVTNDVSSIDLPRGIDVLRIQPASIILSLDTLVQKTFPVNPVTSGTPMVGYILKGLKMDPEVIAITGPETVLTQYEVLRTKPININGLRQSVQRQVPLDLEPAIVDLIGETTITADITIGLEVVQKEYTLPIPQLKNSLPGAKKKVRVIASVPQYLLDQKIRIADFLSVLVVEDEENNVALIKVIPGKELELPVEIVQVDPEAIQLQKKPEPEPAEPAEQEKTPENGDQSQAAP
ncbi:MAG: CdaR family protein [Desulfocapsaceae bacterium]